MRHRFPPVLTHVLRDSGLLTLCLLGSGLVAVQILPVTTPPAIAQTRLTDEQAELERLQQEANLAFTRATTLVSILLAALALLLILGVVMLWFFAALGRARSGDGRAHPAQPDDRSRAQNSHCDP